MSIAADASVFVDGILYEWEYKYGGIDGFKYVATVISRKEKYSGDIVIPSSIKFKDFYEIECKVIAIGNSAFNSCKDLTSVTIPSSVTSIGLSAFRDCSSLKSISLPDGITIIDNSTFYGCIGLTEITIPSGVTTVGAFAFEDCRNLTTVIMPSTVKEIKWSAFQGCESLSSISIPNSVERIDMQSFQGCSSLESINIGSGITNIGNEAFASCSSLKTVNCFAENVPTTNANAFKNTNLKKAVLYVPAGSIDAYKDASPWKDFKHIVAIGSEPPIDKYLLTYKIDGQIFKTVEYEYGATIMPEPTPDGDYLSFEWQDLPSTMPDHDVTVNAKYTRNDVPSQNVHKLIVLLKSGEKIAFVLKDKPQISFNGNQFVIDSTTGSIEYLRSDIEDFHFEESETNVESIEYSGDGNVTIYDINGHMLAKLNNESLNSAKLYLEGYKPGLYIIKIGNKQTIKYLKK